MIQRSVYLGETVNATASFFEDGVLIEPTDSNLSPTYLVKDSNDGIVAFGIGTINVDNLYHCSFNISVNSPISTDEKKYTIEWDLTAKTTGKLYKASEYFDVVHPSYNVMNEKEQQKLALRVVPTVLSLPLPSVPSQISFTLYDQNQNVITFTGNTPTSVGKYDGYFIYNVTIPANTFNDRWDYIGVFTYTINNSQETFVQVIHCADMWAMSKVSDMRMYLDKVMKDMDLYTGYRDSDLYFHLKSGLEMLNMVFPTTSWTWTDFQNTLNYANYALIGYACYSALRSQYLAEGDSAFDYSGQPVSLTVDRTGFIEAEIGRFESWVDNVIKPWKKDTTRKMRNVGNLALAFPSVSGYNALAMNLQYKGFPFRQFYSFRRC